MNIWKLKTYLEELYSRHYRAVVIAARMAAGFLIFFSLNSLTGYNSRLGNPLLLAGLSIASGFFPGSVTLLAASAVTFVQLYSLSLGALVAGGALLLILLLLYFGTVGGGGYDFLLTPVAFTLHIPAAAPVITGLAAGGSRVAGLLCGTVWYFTLDAIKESAPALAGVGGSISSAADIQTVLEETSGLLNTILRSRRMMLFLVVMGAVWLVVWTARRMSIKYAWTAAAAVGILVYFTVRIAGAAMLELPLEIPGTVFFGAVSAALAMAVQFVLFWPDYRKTESLQFEDDDYYYYVKAIPKKKAPKRGETAVPDEESRQERRARRRPAR